MANKEKLKNFIIFKKNASFNTFKFIMDLEIKINQRIIEMLDERMLKIKKGEKGDRGAKGEKGDTIRGLRGMRGLQGRAGLQGVKGSDGQDGKDGRTPTKGVDYLTKKETSSFIGKILEIVNEPIEKIKEEIKKIREDIISLKTTSLGGRKRTLHRGGMKMYVGKMIGTGDGTNRVFTLPSVPYDSSQIVAHIGSSSHFPTEDFTVSGKTITFLFNVPDGAKVAATYQGT